MRSGNGAVAPGHRVASLPKRWLLGSTGATTLFRQTNVCGAFVGLGVAPVSRR